MESQHEYVIRKLKSPVFNHSKVAEAVGVSRDTLLKIESKTTKNPSSRTIEVLFNFFKQLGE